MAPGQRLFWRNLVSWLCGAFFFSVGIKAGGFEFLGAWGVVFLLVVRCLGKYYSYVGRQISPSLSLGAWARLVWIGYFLQRSCPSDYIRHIHHARNTGCCYGHVPRLARSPPHGTSFGWFVFLSSHPIPSIVSRACILHPEEAARFLHHFRSVGKIGVNRILFKARTGKYNHINIVRNYYKCGWSPRIYFKLLSY